MSQEKTIKRYTVSILLKRPNLVNKKIFVGPIFRRLQSPEATKS